MRKIFVLNMLIFFVGSIFSQQLSISGNVVDENKDAVIGASVLIQGTGQGTITDYDGNFSITASIGQSLEISYLGFDTYIHKLSQGDARLSITLKSSAYMLQEVVAIGYGTMKKSDLTGAISSVKADQLQRTPAAGLDQALQGRVSGVTVNANTGQPGAAATVRIRGIGSVIGGSDPIYVVDGMITGDISFLSPNDIQSTEILKDASATAIYGSRGANGVIIVTTKSGSTSKAQANISFDAYWGVQNRWKKLDLMSSHDMAFMKLRIDGMKNGAEQVAYYLSKGFNQWMSVFNTGASPYYPVVKTDANPNGFDYGAVNTDWQDEVFNSNAFISNYNLSIDKGNEQGKYAFSANYFNQEGTIIGSDYERLTLRFNSEFQVRKWLTVGEHLSFMTSRGRNAMNNSSSPGASVISAALAMAPWDPTHYPDGAVNRAGKDLSGQIAASSNFKNVTNPFSMVENSHPMNNRERWVGDLYAEIQPIKDLILRSAINLDLSLVRDRLFKEKYEYSSYDKADKNFVSSSMSRYATLQHETTLTYNKKFDDHSLSAMIGETIEEYNYYSIGGAGASILNPTQYNWYLNNTTEDQTKSSDGVSRQRRNSFLSRLHYTYRDLYMLTVNFRADGTNKFPENTWGYFPSAAFAWRLSEESFMKQFENMDMLKLRVGWGRVGNESIPNNAFDLTMGSSETVFYGYPFGVTQDLQTGAAVLTFVNRNGKWETNEQLNIGVDFSFWNAKLSGNLDVFRRDTKDAHLYVNAPAHAGNRYSLIKNVGVIRNQGVEISLEHQNKIGQIDYNVGGNVSFIQNNLVALNGGSPIYGDKTKTDLGLPVNTFWGYIYEGVYASDAEALAHLTSFTSETIGVHAGDARYKDISGPDGTPDGKIDDFDKTNIGNPFPWLTYGLNFSAEYKGFDLQLFLQGVYGNEIYNALRYRTEGVGDDATLSADMKNAWIGYTDAVRNAMINRGVNWMDLENRQGTIPNPAGAPTNTEVNSRFVESGAYLRIKNVQLGYTLPKEITEKVQIERVRFYVTANNLLTITSYGGYDPEVGGGVDYGNYPQSRTMMLGVNVNF